MIHQLDEDKFEVKAAFWLYSSDADPWHLYLASGVVDHKGAAEAYRELGRSMRRLTDLRIRPLEVKLVGTDHPLAIAVVNFQSVSPAARPTRVRGANLGREYIEDAYIY